MAVPRDSARPAGYPFVYISWLFILAAIVCFLLFAFGADVGSRDGLLGVGLALFAAGHIVP